MAALVAAATTAAAAAANAGNETELQRACLATKSLGRAHCLAAAAAATGAAFALPASDALRPTEPPKP